MNDNWESLAMGQAEIISSLSHLCYDLIHELVMYRETEQEETKMNSILRGGNTIEPRSKDSGTYID